jgi:hypothetical protein
MLRAGGHDEHNREKADHESGERQDEAALAHATRLPGMSRTVARALTRATEGCGASSALVRSSCVERTVPVPRRVASSERAEAMRRAATASRHANARKPSVVTEGSIEGRTFG